MTNRLIKIGMVLLLTLLLLCNILCIWLYNCYTNFNKLYDYEQSIHIIIRPQTSLEHISESLSAHKVITSAFQFKWFVRLKGFASCIQAGEYKFPATRSALSVMEQLINGNTIQHYITIPEGLTSQQVVNIVNSAPFLIGNINNLPSEGTLLPETYAYHYGEKRSHVLARMQAAMNKTIDQLWHERHQHCLLQSPEDALILASIIEKETSLLIEQADVAAVFLNRLKLKMPLQSDPTVIYALENTLQQPLKRDLTRNDLKFDHPYNTYLIAALPPGPICNPSVGAIRTVLKPAISDNLFFVADGSGGHVFAKTYQKHQENHRNWRLVRKRLAKKPL